jgi:hypothetical protein
MASTELVDCPKCGGIGKIFAFSSVENGKCFECMGARKVSVRSRSVLDRARQQASYEIWHAVEEFQDYGDVTDVGIERVAKALLAMHDTKKAREMLALIGRQCGSGLRAQIIEAGRRLKEVS